MLGRDRIQYKTRDQVRRDAARPGWSSPTRSTPSATAPRAGVDDRGARRGRARTSSADAGADPVVPRLPRLPGDACISVNDEVVHGIPGPRALRAGDVVSVDCGAIVDGWHGDAAFTRRPVADGSTDAADAELGDVTEESMWAGDRRASSAARAARATSAARSRTAWPARYGVVEDYGGHGIGTEMHQAPDVLNYRTPRPRAAAARPACAWRSSRCWSAGRPRETACWTTAGRSSPGTAAAPPTGSTGRAARRRDRGCSPPATAARPRWRPCGVTGRPAGLSPAATGVPSPQPADGVLCGVGSRASSSCA